ncbi:hypothetical protein P5V15_005624 [Pogonomyrmex californicus]
MELIKLLLNSNLIFISVTALSLITHPENFRLPDNIVPENYSVELTLDNEGRTFYGRCNNYIIISKATRNITLHVAELDIIHSTETLKLIKILPRYERVYYVDKISYIDDLQIVILHFEYEVLPCNIEKLPCYLKLKMEFTGTIASNTGGFLKTSYKDKKGNKKWYLTTRNSMTATRHLFPCWDEPNLIANFTIILIHHENYTAFSNVPAVSLKLPERNKMLTYFFTTPKISTYLIAIVLFETASFSVTSSKHFNLWRRQSVMQYETFAFNIMENVTRKCGYAWPLWNKHLPYIYLAIAGMQDDYVDKWQFISYRETDITYDEQIDSAARKIEISRLIGRKVVGQWFDTIITPRWWSYMWLNEGIATLFGVYIINQTVPDSRMLDLFVVQTLQESLHLDQEFMNPLEPDINSISELHSIVSFSYYMKAPAILRMVQHVLSNEVFQNGIDIAMKRKSGLNGFWSAMQFAYEAKALKETVNIKDVIDPWIKQKHYPVLNVVNFHLDIKSKIVNILLETTSKTQKIPVTYTVKSYVNFENTLSEQWLLWSIPSYITISDDWIICNLQQTGYYRVNYYEENWLKIAHYLNSTNYMKIHVLNRAQIIDDAFYFITSGELHHSVFWKIVDYLSRETDYIAWYPMFKAIERMSHILLLDINKIFNFKIKIIRLLDSLLQQIGYEENRNENDLIKCLRQEATKWACVLGDSRCKKKALEKLEWHLSNQTNNELLPWWEHWTYCNGLSIANDTIFNKILSGLEEPGAKNMKILQCLICTNRISHFKFIILHLRKSIYYSEHVLKIENSRAEYNSIIKNHISIFHYIIQRYANDSSLLSLILENWSNVKPKEISTTTALNGIINHIYSITQWNMIDENLKESVILLLKVKFQERYSQIDTQKSYNYRFNYI